MSTIDPPPAPALPDSPLRTREEMFRILDDALAAARHTAEVSGYRQGWGDGFLHGLVLGVLATAAVLMVVLR